MIETKTRTPVWSFQDGLKKTGKVDKHVAHQKEPVREGGRGREGERERERERGRERERERGRGGGGGGSGWR